MKREKKALLRDRMGTERVKKTEIVIMNSLSQQNGEPNWTKLNQIQQISQNSNEKMIRRQSRNNRKHV